LGSGGKDTKMVMAGAVATVLLAAMGCAAYFAPRRTVEPPRATARPSVLSGLPHSAEHVDWHMRVVKVYPEGGVISAFEPVIVELEMRNEMAAPVGVGYSCDESPRIEVRDSKGELVGDTPFYSYAEQLAGGFDLDPTQSARSFAIPSAVYRFRKPGVYAVRIMMLAPARGIAHKLSDLGPPMAEVTTSVTVRPFDRKRLQRRCTELVQPRKISPRSSSIYPEEQHMKALWSVRHNAALPTLKFVAVTCRDSSYEWPTVAAIRRIGTPEAAAVLKSLRVPLDRGSIDPTAAANSDRSVAGVGAFFIDWKVVKTPETTVSSFLYYFRHKRWDQVQTLFSDYFRRKNASDLRNGNWFTSTASSGVRSILNDPNAKVLQTRRQGKFVIVDVGQRPVTGTEGNGIVQIQLIGSGEWHLSDFPKQAKP